MSDKEGDNKGKIDLAEAAFESVSSMLKLSPERQQVLRDAIVSNHNSMAPHEVLASIKEMLQKELREFKDPHYQTLKTEGASGGGEKFDAANKALQDLEGIMQTLSESKLNAEAPEEEIDYSKRASGEFTGLGGDGTQGSQHPYGNAHNASQERGGNDQMPFANAAASSSSGTPYANAGWANTPPNRQAPEKKAPETDQKIVIGAGQVVNGSIHSQGKVVIQGTVNGDVTAKENVVVGMFGSVTGDVRSIGGKIVNQGTIGGNMYTGSSKGDAPEVVNSMTIEINGREVAPDTPPGLPGPNPEGRVIDI